MLTVVQIVDAIPSFRYVAEVKGERAFFLRNKEINGSLLKCVTCNSYFFVIIYIVYPVWLKSLHYLVDPLTIIGADFKIWYHDLKDTPFNLWNLKPRHLNDKVYARVCSCNNYLSTGGIFYFNIFLLYSCT